MVYLFFLLFKFQHRGMCNFNKHSSYFTLQTFTHHERLSTDRTGDVTHYVPLTVGEVNEMFPEKPFSLHVRR